MGLIPNISPLESGKALVAAIVRLAIKAISERQRNKLPLPGASGHLSLSILWAWGSVLSAWIAEHILLWSQA